MDCSIPGFPVHHQLLEFTHTHVHWVSDAIQHLILCRPLLFLPLIFPNLRVFSNESAFHIRWPKYWNFSFSISLSNECLGLIHFRIDWFDLLAIQGNLKSLLQHYSSKTSVHQCSVFFIVQLSLPYMTTGKTIALTRCTFVLGLKFYPSLWSWFLLVAFPKAPRLLWWSASIMSPQNPLLVLMVCIIPSYIVSELICDQ